MLFQCQERIKILLYGFDIISQLPLYTPWVQEIEMIYISLQVNVIFKEISEIFQFCSNISF